jgi:predicted HTH domain antitoxin
MTIHFDIPKDIEAALAGEGADPNFEARQAFLIELYRRGRIGHSALAEAMGMSRYALDGLLKARGIWLDTTAEEVFADIEGLRKQLKR